MESFSVQINQDESDVDQFVWVFAYILFSLDIITEMIITNS